MEQQIAQLAAALGYNETDTIAFLAGIELQIKKGHDLESAIRVHASEMQDACVRGLDAIRRRPTLAKEFVVASLF